MTPHGEEPGRFSFSHLEFFYKKTPLRNLAVSFYLSSIYILYYYWCQKSGAPPACFLAPPPSEIWRGFGLAKSQ